jgi:hypothetical protein
MMASVTWLEGSLSASTSNSTADLIGQLGIDGCTWASDRPVSDATIDGDTFQANVGGLYSWTVNAPFKFPETPQHGINATLTQAGSGLYLTGWKSFSLSISAEFADTTDASATAARTFALGGPIIGTGTYVANVDDTTSVKLPNVGDTATFGIGADTNPNIIKGAVLITSASSVRARPNATEITYGFAFNGAIQVDGDNGLFPVSSPGTPEDIPQPAQDTIVVTTSSGKTITGPAAWSAINISANQNDVIAGDVTLQGLGAVTIA